MTTYIAVEKNQSSHFYVSDHIWNLALEIHLFGKGFEFREVKDINNEGLLLGSLYKKDVNVESFLYRMYMSNSLPLRTIRRKISVVNTIESLKRILDTL